MPTRSAGLLPACLRGSVCPTPKTAPLRRSTASSNRSRDASTALGSTAAIINAEKTTQKRTRRPHELHSISIIPARITATAANACAFLLTSLSKTPRTKFRDLHQTRFPSRFRSRLAVTHSECLPHPETGRVCPLLEYAGGQVADPRCRIFLDWRIAATSGAARSR